MPEVRPVPATRLILIEGDPGADGLGIFDGLDPLTVADVRQAIDGPPRGELLEQGKPAPRAPRRLLLRVKKQRSTLKRLYARFGTDSFRYDHKTATCIDASGRGRVVAFVKAGILSDLTAAGVIAPVGDGDTMRITGAGARTALLIEGKQGVRPSILEGLDGAVRPSIYEGVGLPLTERVGPPPEFVKQGRVTLYHFTRQDHGDTFVIDPEKSVPHRGSYSRRDYQASGRPRTFFYLDPADKETLVGNALYTVTLDARRIYDLVSDPNGLKRQASPYGFLDFDKLFDLVVAAGFDGIYYNPGFPVVNLFVPVKAEKAAGRLAASAELLGALMEGEVTKLRFRRREGVYITTALGHEWRVGKMWDHRPPNWYWERDDYIETGDEMSRIGEWRYTKREAIEDLRQHLLRHGLTEGKAIGSAILKANVAERDRPFRVMDPSTIKRAIRQASSNAPRALQQVYAEARRALPPIVMRLSNGTISLEEAQLRSAVAFRRLYERMREVGRRASGLRELGADEAVYREEERWFRSAVREELRYWNTFLAEVESGDAQRIPERVNAYIDALRFMYEASRIAAMPDNTLLHWVGPRDERLCPGCAYLLEMSPFTKDNIPAVPRDGSTSCLTHCRHRIVVRVANNLNEVVRRRQQLPRRDKMVRELKRLQSRGGRELARPDEAKARNPFARVPLTRRVSRPV